MNPEYFSALLNALCPGFLYTPTIHCHSGENMFRATNYSQPLHDRLLNRFSLNRSSLNRLSLTPQLQCRDQPIHVVEIHSFLVVINSLQISPLQRTVSAHPILAFYIPLLIMHPEMAVEKQHNFMGPASNVSSNPFHKPRPIESESAEKLEAQKADYEARIADMSKVSQANLENTIKDYEAKLSEKEKLQEIEIERVRDFIKHDCVEIKKKSEIKLNDLAENYEAKIAYMEAESQSKLEKTIRKYEAELIEEEKHGDWLLQEMRKGHETEIAEIKEKHALESEAATEDYEADLGRLNQSSAILQRAFADQSLELAELKEMKTKKPEVAEGKDTKVLTDEKANVDDKHVDVNDKTANADKKPEIDALKGTIDALKDTVGIQMVAADDLRETVKDLRERVAKLEAER
ncbi:uncharacterized protein J4E79_006415 [Alternaria viburni]|uniref:uncharacterized protein n=1 Tax=Alternaria viburni TaxID=566460 RepID=UPI0020C3E401|nr:uncharacterized protein J4E79_006415 [Alternaria viburni]KAI4658657.1 hypothetical protein J4E79_006415 [Alternaria viburni]